MEAIEILQRISLGEDSSTEFKREPIPPAKLAEEMVAFLNAHGGLILFGVADDGAVVGLTGDQIRNLNSSFSSACSDHVRPACYPETQLCRLGEGPEERTVMVVVVPEGISKPYSDKGGRYWIRSGPDKRTIQEREQLQRLMQDSRLIFADELSVERTNHDDLDFDLLNAYLQKDRHVSLADIQDNDSLSLDQVLENLNLMRDGELTLAALMMFGKNPQKFRPAFCVKAVSFVGNDITGSAYRDSEDMVGNLEQLYQKVMSFLTRNLHHVQGDSGFNSLGALEIPDSVLEELVVNMLLHRNYFISAPWRVFVFDDRIELVSPGALPNHLTIENVRNGISNMRNPVLASFGTKILPYRGLGTGILRALRERPDIDFISDKDAELFTVRIPRR